MVDCLNQDLQDLSGFAGFGFCYSFIVVVFTGNKYSWRERPRSWLTMVPSLPAQLARQGQITFWRNRDKAERPRSVFQTYERLATKLQHWYRRSEVLQTLGGL